MKGKIVKKQSKVVRKKRKKQHLNKQTVISMMMVTCVVLALLLVVTIKSIELREKNSTYDQTIVALDAEIAAEQARSADIAKDESDMDSPEQIEKIARERLGLIDRNEIVFESE